MYLFPVPGKCKVIWDSDTLSEVAKGGPSKGGRQSLSNSVNITIIANIIIRVLKLNLQRYQQNYSVCVVIGDPL